MVKNMSFPLLAVVFFLAVVSLGRSLKAPQSVRLIPPSTGSGRSLEKLFAAVRQTSQDARLTSKTLPRCNQKSLNRTTEIGETCLSCTTNVDTGQVSNCPEGCCRTFKITEDLETAHFITCYKGCCSRSVAVLSPFSDREAGTLEYQEAFSVNNDLTLNEITSLGQCMVEDGSSQGCGQSCAVFAQKGTPCSNAKSFQVPEFGQGLVDPPCVEEDIPSSPGPEDETPRPDRNGNDNGNGDIFKDDDDIDGDDDGEKDVGNGRGARDTDATGPAGDGDPEDDEVGDDEDGAAATGPVDGGGVVDDDADMDGGELELSPTEEVEESPGETDAVGATLEQDTGDRTETDDPVCFPGEATVELKNGDTKKMEELRADDMVLVRTGKYSRVFGFTHEKRDYRGRFVELRTKSGHILRLTHGHYIHSDGVTRRAREVRVGYAVNLGNGKASEVTEVGEWTGNGLFNPQTVDGDIVVDGVVVSTYTEAVDARTAHALLTPLRAISEWVDVSSLLSHLATALREGKKAMASARTKSV